jgi:carbon storage regulator
MLVLSRRKGQSILIGDDIEVIVTQLHRSSVKIAVRAPKHLTVIRAEVAAEHEPDVEPDSLEEP